MRYDQQFCVVVLFDYTLLVLTMSLTRRVARNFDRGGKQHPGLNIEIFNAHCFCKHYP